MGYCSICKRDHEGTACHNDDKPIYNEAMDVIAELKKKLAEKEAELAAARNALKFILEDTGDEFDCPRCHAACRKALKEAE
jgi:hypothetical protein